jgi:hypothetical protein
VEADNRALGDLGEWFGDEPLKIQLRRDPTLWDRLAGEGDLEATMAEFGVRHDRSRTPMPGRA